MAWIGASPHPIFIHLRQDLHFTRIVATPQILCHNWQIETEWHCHFWDSFWRQNYEVATPDIGCWFLSAIDYPILTMAAVCGSALRALGHVLTCPNYSFYNTFLNITPVILHFNQTPPYFVARFYPQILSRPSPTLWKLNLWNEGIKFYNAICNTTRRCLVAIEWV